MYQTHTISKQFFYDVLYLLSWSLYRTRMRVKKGVSVPLFLDETVPVYFVKKIRSLQNLFSIFYFSTYLYHRESLSQVWDFVLNWNILKFLKFIFLIYFWKNSGRFFSRNLLSYFISHLLYVEKCFFYIFFYHYHLFW